MYLFFKFTILLVFLFSDILTENEKINCGVKYVNNDFNKEIRHGAVNLEKGVREKWPNGIVYYKFHENLTKEHKTMIETVMLEISAITNSTKKGRKNGKICIEFKKRSNNQNNYVTISLHDGCYVDCIGKNVTGSQNLYLNANCSNKRTIKHLLIHVLGFDHEQNRPDRGNHVEILKQNIKDEGQKYFAIVPNSNYIDYGTPYDYKSIMHLSDDAFSKNENKTMIGKNGNIIVPGVELTNYDVREINLLYECSANLEKRDVIWNGRIGSNCELPGKRFEVVNATDVSDCETKCNQTKDTECTHFIFNENNNDLVNGSKVYPQDGIDEDYGDDDSKIELGYENDQREILSFGFNGSCILKTGGVSKSDAKFYRGFKQKRLSCGIRKPLVSTNEKFKKIGGRKFPPDLGFYHQITSNTYAECEEECNKQSDKCIMFTFYKKVTAGVPFCRFYDNSYEVIQNGTEGVYSYQRKMTKKYSPPSETSDSSKQLEKKRVFIYLISIFILKCFF